MDREGLRARLEKTSRQWLPTGVQRALALQVVVGKDVPRVIVVGLAPEYGALVLRAREDLLDLLAEIDLLEAEIARLKSEPVSGAAGEAAARPPRAS